MVESYLLAIGMRCGTVKNFSNTIVEDMRTNSKQHWYFLTPIKSVDKGSLLKEATIQFAFPFVAIPTDISERDVLKRLEKIIGGYEHSLLIQLKKMLLVQSVTFSIIPFWANEKGERIERKNLGQSSIHILNAQITVRYRDSWFDCNCN